MGYELWTSKVTGYRRTGTRLSEVRRLFETEISTSSILEPLASCALDASASDVRHQLEQRQFDVAGVKEDQQGPLVGFIYRADLDEGLVSHHLCPFQEQDLIADSTPLADVIGIISQRKFQFVMVGPRVQGIVVAADLNKPPVRIFLFGLVSLLEMHLGYWIRREFGSEKWKAKLSRSRLEAACKRFDDRKRKNDEITLLSCLQFCDKRDLFVSSKRIGEKLKLETRGVTTRRLKHAENLRNHLAHSQDDIAAETTWADIAETVQWIESLLQKSDKVVEEEAAIANSVPTEFFWH